MTGIVDYEKMQCTDCNRFFPGRCQDIVACPLPEDRTAELWDGEDLIAVEQPTTEEPKQSLTATEVNERIGEKIEILQKGIFPPLKSMKSHMHAYVKTGSTTSTEPQPSVPSNTEKSEGVNPKIAWGDSKAPYGAVPESALIELGNVMGGGAYKYGLFNFRETPVPASVYHDAIRRHLALFFDGEDYDPVYDPDDPEAPPGSGAHHLAHVMACCALVIDSQALGKLVDDRPKTGLVRAALRSSAERFADFRRAYDEWKAWRDVKKAE